MEKLQKVLQAASNCLHDNSRCNACFYNYPDSNCRKRLIEDIESVLEEIREDKYLIVFSHNPQNSSFELIELAHSMDCLTENIKNILNVFEKRGDASSYRSDQALGKGTR